MFELLMDYLYSSEFCTLRWEHRHNEPTNLCLKYDPPGNQEQSITEYFRTGSRNTYAIFMSYMHIQLLQQMIKEL